MLDTVAVTSLREYNFLSKGTIVSEYPIIPVPTLFTIFTNSSLVSGKTNPGIASNLSIVPPVCPKPLPESFAVPILKAANNPAKAIVVLSPTPPVECLSIKNFSIPSNFITSPLFIISSVNTFSSSFVIPLK